MDNKELIERAKDFASSGDSYTGPEVRLCVSQLTDALERAEAELAKYRSAEVQVYMEPAFCDEFSPTPREGWLPLIILPEAP